MPIGVRALHTAMLQKVLVHEGMQRTNLQHGIGRKTDHLREEGRKIRIKAHSIEPTVQEGDPREAAKASKDKAPKFRHLLVR